MTSVVPYDLNNLENDLLELDIEDYQEEEGRCRIVTSFEAFTSAKKALDEKQYSIVDADLQYLPQNELTLSDEDFNTFQQLYEALEEDEDVDSIYHNVG